MSSSQLCGWFLTRSRKVAIAKRRRQQHAEARSRWTRQKERKGERAKKKKGHACNRCRLWSTFSIAPRKACRVESADVGQNYARSGVLSFAKARSTTGWPRQKSQPPLRGCRTEQAIVRTRVQSGSHKTSSHKKVVALFRLSCSQFVDPHVYLKASSQSVAVATSMVAAESRPRPQITQVWVYYKVIPVCAGAEHTADHRSNLQRVNRTWADNKILDLYVRK